MRISDWSSDVCSSDLQPAALEIVEASQPLAITLAMVRPWKKRIDTVANTRRLYLEYLAQALVNRRLANTARAGGSYLVPTVEQSSAERRVGKECVRKCKYRWAASH